MVKPGTIAGAGVLCLRVLWWDCKSPSWGCVLCSESVWTENVFEEGELLLLLPAPTLSCSNTLVLGLTPVGVSHSRQQPAGNEQFKLWSEPLNCSGPAHKWTGSLSSLLK